jgi:hypothetical protein
LRDIGLTNFNKASVFWAEIRHSSLQRSTAHAAMRQKERTFGAPIARRRQSEPHLENW